MSERDALAKATRFEELANNIEADPEWFADPNFGDDEIMDALRIAARTLRDSTAKVNPNREAAQSAE